MRVQTNRVATEMQNYQSTDGHITRKKNTVRSSSLNFFVSTSSQNGLDRYLLFG